MGRSSKLSKYLASFTFVCAALMGGARSSLAHPVTYQGGFSFMSWNGPMMSDQWLSYSVTSRFAVAARYFGLRPISPGGAPNRDFFLPQVSFLLHRWNGLGYQANIYLTGAYGLERKDASSSPAALGAIEADIESRRYYASGKYQAIRMSDNGPLDYARARVGYAPYLAEFNELHTWLMLQAEYQPEYFRSVQVSPMLRFFYNNVLWEVGSSFTGNWMFNFMVHF